MVSRLVLITILVLTTLASSSVRAVEGFSEVGYGSVDYGANFSEAVGTYGVGFGEFFNDFFGAQVDWYYNSQPAQPPCPVPICNYVVAPDHRLSLRALGRLPLGERVELVAGVGRVRLSSSYTTRDQFEDLLSFGVGWRINETFTLSIQHQASSGDANGYVLDSNNSIDTVTLRYRY